MRPLTKRQRSLLSRLYIGWEGYYQRSEGGNVWWWCHIIGFDDNAPVVRTAKGRYHRIPLDSRFYTQPPTTGTVKGEPRAPKKA